MKKKLKTVNYTRLDAMIAAQQENNEHQQFEK